MATRMSLQLPIERGAQLAAFADAHGLNHGEAIGLLLDHATKTGLTDALALPGVEINTKEGSVEITLDRFALAPLTVAQARSFAAQLRKVATTPGAVILDMDAPDIIEFRRQGSGVVLAVRAKGETFTGPRDRRDSRFARVYAKGVAVALADMCDQAASAIETVAGLDDI